LIVFDAQLFGVVDKRFGPLKVGPFDGRAGFAQQLVRGAPRIVRRARLTQRRAGNCPGQENSDARLAVQSGTLAFKAILLLRMIFTPSRSR
jgi:hypothetical protein